MLTLGFQRKDDAVDYSDFIILLARQRSGTNALRSVLGSHPDVFCLNEVFNLADRNADDGLLRDTNFFNFLDRYAQRDLSRILPDKHEKVFLDFLEYLRCFSAKRYLLVDVKYNTTHFLAKPWSDNITSPYFFDLVTTHGLRVMNVTRRNYLRYVLSVLKGWNSGRYTARAGDPGYADKRLRLDPAYVMKELEKCEAEDQLIAKHFAGYPHYFSCDYAELFPGTAGPAAAQLDAIAAWLGIDASFEGTSEFEKLSRLPLAKTVENFDEIATCLGRTKFEYCLEDEVAYERMAADQEARPAAAPAVIIRPIRSVLEEVIGCKPGEFCDAYYAQRPRWIQGSVSHRDARFLFRAALDAGVTRAVELGTASGFSTGLLCHALHFNALASDTDHLDFRVATYDLRPRFYGDPARRVGDAAREQLPSELLKHIEFRHPAVALDVARDYAADPIGFLFIDANHRHPWPALDLFAMLDALKPGATVLLHDINLPLVHPEIQDWGVKYLFDELDVDKSLPQDEEIPNIGQITIPENRSRLRAQLLEIVFGHLWQVDPRADLPDDYLERLGIHTTGAGALNRLDDATATWSIRSGDRRWRQ